MSAKTNRLCTFVIVMALGAFVAWSVIKEVPVYVIIAGVAIALLLVRVCRRYTKEIMVDERLQKINEKAAAISYRIFSIVMALLSVVFIAMKQNLPPEFNIVSATLAYSVCALMLIHLGFYYYYGKKL